MSTTTAGILLIGSLVLAVALAYKPFGDYMYRSVSTDTHSRVERAVYRAVGVDPDGDQPWGVYARSVLAFSAVSVLGLYLFQRVQDRLWLSLGFDAVKPDQAWNTAVSFVTNTNWQIEAFAAHAAIALRQQNLAEQAAVAGSLAEVDRLRTALLSAVSHDLRTPLAAAKAAVGSLRSPDLTFSAADRDELLATAEDSLDRLNRLVANLLDMSRLQAGALALELEPVRVADAVARAVDDLAVVAREVRLSIPDELPQVSADPALLERILVNVVANAVRHSPPGSPPVVTASEHAGRVEVRVIDHGPGIPAAARERVFQPFQRLGDRDNATGVGLGLALARGLAEAMSGSLRPDSTPGGGVTMVLALPTADAADPALLERLERARPGR